jgi:hypothetical protein
MAAIQSGKTANAVPAAAARPISWRLVVVLEAFIALPPVRFCAARRTSIDPGRQDMLWRSWAVAEF